MQSLPCESIWKVLANDPIFTREGNGTWCHHFHVKVLQKTLSDDPHIILLPKRQWYMIPSLPCESTQKMLSNDPYIIYYQKRQCLNLYIPKLTCTNIFTPSKNSNRSVCGKKCNHLIHLGQIKWLHNNFHWIPLEMIYYKITNFQSKPPFPLPASKYFNAWFASAFFYSFWFLSIVCWKTPMGVCKANRLASSSSPSSSTRLSSSDQSPSKFSSLHG